MTGRFHKFYHTHENVAFLSEQIAKVGQYCVRFITFCLNILTISILFQLLRA
jgi:hypothetical protein